MLYLLAFVFLLFVILSFILSGRDALSPTFLLSGVFFICNVFSIAGNSYWNVEISPKVCIFFLYAFFFILLGELFSNKVECWSTSNKSIQLSRIDQCNRAQYFMVIIFLFVQCFVLYQYYQRLVDMAAFAGYAGDNLQQFVRIAVINYGVHVGVAFAVFIPAISAGAVIFFYLWCTKFLIHRKLKSWDSLFLVPFVISLYSSSFSGARSGAIASIILAYFLFVFVMREKKGWINMVQLFVGTLFLLFVLGFVFVFLGSLALRINESSYMSSLYIYGGSPLVALDVWLNLKGAFFYGLFDGTFAEESFSGIRITLNRFFPIIEAPSPFLEFVSFPNGSSTNIYTGFRSYIKDFGMLGIPFICCLLGFVFGSCNKYLRRKNSPAKLMIYVYFLKNYLYLVFAPSITSALFSPSQFFWIVWFVILGYLILGKNFTKPL
ncbi:MAG: oligosaccharide repeat unit polymerase [Alphaproteobacteria bacterium]|nr:oligosaccharide repeat unit polymerase [Alphaproteobacteria bacterium]